MTIGGVNCNAQVLLNELTCRIPKGLVIPSTGLPVKVRESTSTSRSSAENHFNLNTVIRSQPPTPPLQVLVNSDIYDVGTVVKDESNHTLMIVGIVLGIIIALVAGAGLAYIVMDHLKKKKRGEEILPFLHMMPGSSFMVVSGVILTETVITGFTAHFQRFCGFYSSSSMCPFSNHREPFVNRAFTQPLQPQWRFFSDRGLQTR